MDFEGLQNLLRESGVVGAGGAGFPAYGKLNQNIDTILINCAECEPLLRLHRQLIERRATEILETARKVADIIGAKDVIICVKKAYTKAVESINTYLENHSGVKACYLKEVYPAGDEVVLIYEATKRIVGPGKLPASVGVIVYNVETMYNIYHAMKGKPVTHKFVTISGEVASPKTFYAPIGSKIYGLIKRSGGVTIENPEILIGGPMMGRLGKDTDVVTKTTNAIIVLPKDHYVVQRKKTKVTIDAKRAMAACCQCSYCTDLCPRHLLGHPINPSELMRVVSNQDSHTFTPYLNAIYCSGCGVCEMYACHQGLSPRNLLGLVKNAMRANGVRAPEVKEAPIANPEMELRRVPLKRLRARLDLEKYNKAAPLYEDPINAKEVVIMLNQHIGVPAIPCVKVGELVKEGQVIANAAEGKLSVNIHASIDGEVYEITDTHISVRNVRR